MKTILAAALVLLLPSAASWQMDVTVSTARGETYKNTLSWK